MDINADDFVREITEQVAEDMLLKLEETRREMGAEGQNIRIDKDAALNQTGDRFTVAGVHFPSTAVGERFMEIFKSKMS